VVRRLRQSKRTFQTHTFTEKHRFWLLFSVFAVGICLFAISSLFRGKPQEPFIAIAVAGNPITVVYIDRTTNRTSLISMPPSTYIDACSSYGTYPVSSLWRLGEIEKKGGSILASSIGNALGIPIKFYIGPRTFPDTPQDPQQHLSQMFSFLTIPEFLVGNVKTNMSLATYVEALRSVRNALPKTTILDLSRTYALSKRDIDDGSVVSAVNPDGADLVFRQTHELTALRDENIRVMIVNTTGVVGLGQKIARILSHVGMTIVGTESEDRKFDECEVTASPSVVSSLTVKTIVSYFSCGIRTSSDTGRADVVLRLGNKDTKRF